MPPPQHLPPKWEDVKDHVVLYHGTASVFQTSVLTAVDPGRGTFDRDFGPGFYATTFEYQAKLWANKVALKLRAADPAALRKNPGWQSADPLVVWFRLPVVRLAALRARAFVRPNPDNDLFWSFVSHCRDFPTRPAKPARYTHGYAHPNGRGMYDVVSGPVAAEWAGKGARHFRREVYGDFDQFSFHTPEAAAIFADVLKGKAGEDFGHAVYPLTP